MPRINIPAMNWATALGDVVRTASGGDIIVVQTETMKQLAQRAIQRQGRTDLTVEVISSQEGSIDDEIARATQAELSKAAHSATASVQHAWGTFHKRPDGTWKGGEFGVVYSDMPLYQELEQLLAQQTSE
jgi:hypothetical protein